MGEEMRGRGGGREGNLEMEIVICMLPEPWINT